MRLVLLITFVAFKFATSQAQMNMDTIYMVNYEKQSFKSAYNTFETKLKENPKKYYMSEKHMIEMAQWVSETDQGVISKSTVAPLFICSIGFG